MPRINTVTRSRVERDCTPSYATHHVIPVGSTITSATPGYRATTLYRCAAHPFRPSELTASLAAYPMREAEAFEDAARAGFDSIEDLKDQWNLICEAARDYYDAREFALQSWPNGNAAMEEARDRADAALSEVESFEPLDFEEEEPLRSGYLDQIAFEEAYEAYEVAMAAHLDEQTQDALYVLGNVEW